MHMEVVPYIQIVCYLPAPQRCDVQSSPAVPMRCHRPHRLTLFIVHFPVLLALHIAISLLLSSTGALAKDDDGHAQRLAEPLALLHAGPLMTASPPY